MNSKELAWKIRRHGIEMTHISKGSHIGSVLSVTDIIAVLYADTLNFNPKNPRWVERDRVILSKGHAGAAIYAALAECGFFDVEELKTHYANGSRLSGHVSHKGVPGVEFSTGSLGHGLPVGCGMAMAAKKNKQHYRVFVICGDGECDEGAVWEAALFAHHYHLDNLIAVIDHNKMQSLDFCENTITLAPFADKWKAFGWHVLDIDGHDHLALKNAYETACQNKDKPTVIIANTIKGKGISFMENNILWHYRTPQGEEYDAAVGELEGQRP
ncbi:Apulose-4-phosphate transketolase subunit A [Sporomusa silvacetica DSM 10669]|uniref:Apulose-4-phosphate transketolase subunit A n=1 Tax=Sporomusa silvacetica DSM 10669 TaxID=1123289 RepID=A0ABZ3IHF5_9FIRM|nr:transketolase [Sporomusa silvacetica]OZC21445.1 transketolase 1 [Sporomusa silvacetica DSM 10669]